MASEGLRLLDHFQEIDLKRPADVIMQQIRGLISTGVLKPGDRLPSERALVERFGVGRAQVRDAIKRLAIYGILKTIPQSGTIVASLGVKALEGLISNVLELEREDFKSLMETRGMLEIHAARLAAERAAEPDLQDLRQAHEKFRRQVEEQHPGLEEDMMFHLKIAECSRNSVLRSLISLIMPDILTLSQSLDTCRDGRFRVALSEHEAILGGITARDAERAAGAMAAHMRMSPRQYEGRAGQAA
jgi:GntR family transcriptional repressor for pyruvate dehydrogenase complex